MARKKSLSTGPLPDAHLEALIERAKAITYSWATRHELWCDSFFPELRRLAQVAPLDMSQQAFLSRCKALHELLQKAPKGFLKSLLRHAGCSKESIESWGSLKLLEGLLNIVGLNANEEAADAFSAKQAPEGWNMRHPAMAPLFANNELRIADAHETADKCVGLLQGLDFDTASINAGYGRALDFIFDRVTGTLVTVASAIEQFLRRSPQLPPTVDGVRN